MKLITLTACCALSLLVSSCTSVTPLHPAGEKVLTTTTTPPATCHFLKTITLKANNGVDMPYRSHEVIQTDQSNQLRNTAASLGGNVFVVRNHETTYASIALTQNKVKTAKQDVTASSANALVDAHEMSGDVYLCDSKTLATLRAAQPGGLPAKLDDATK